MDRHSLQSLLSDLPLGSVDYFSVLDSTNAQAQRWIENGAPHLSLVVADEQTAGRGRNGRAWFTPRDAALAFSLVLEPVKIATVYSPFLTGLGALATCEVLHSNYGLQAKIKWPNDVLFSGKKLSGVLVEVDWQGEEIRSMVLGIGINVAPDSVPPESEVSFPATCVETALGGQVNRWVLMKEVLRVILYRLPDIHQAEFLHAWEYNLAFKGETVKLLQEGSEPVIGRLLGLRKDGSLRLEIPNQGETSFQAGEIHLREVDTI
jgi:BirA family biotin operon repressor/biotin-[acetyl-CoA-carboxylase] ligase